MRRVLVAMGGGGLFLLGCSLLSDIDGLSTGPRDDTTDAPHSSSSSDAPSSTTTDSDVGAKNDAPDVVVGTIAFGGVVAKSLVANDCPCVLNAPAVTGANAIMLLAISLNAHDEDLPSSVMYDGVDLGPPDQTTRVPYTRIALWHVTNPKPTGAFTLDWSPNHTENGVMMAAYYTGVDQANPYRSPPEIRTEASSPAVVSVPSSAQALDHIVSFFALNDTSESQGLTAARVGSRQTFRYQLSNTTNESQMSLSDAPFDPSGDPTHRWEYSSGSPWAGIAIALAPAP